MTATATDTTVAGILQDKTMPLKELLAQSSTLAVGQAWSAGLIEFGRRVHIVSGPVGKKGSAVVIEGDSATQPMDWTGPKTSQHGLFTELVKWTVPTCEKYNAAWLPRVKVIEESPTGNVEYTVMGQVTREEAEALLAFHVRLTDKGLASIGVA